MITYRQTDKRGIINALILGLYLNLVPIIIASQFVPGFRRSNVYNLMVGGIFIIQIISIFYQASKYSLKVEKRTILYGSLFALLMIVTLMIQSFNPSVYWDKYDFINVQVRFFAFCSFFCILSCIYITKDCIFKFMESIVLLGVIASVYNLIINGNQLIYIFNIRNAYKYSFQSFYLNKNTFAQLLLFSIIANTILYDKKRTKMKVFYFILFGFNLVATFSRTSIAATLIFFITYFFIKYQKKIFKKIYLFIGGLIISYGLWINNKLRNFIIITIVRSEMGTTRRTELWDIAFQILNKNSWFFGIGYFTAVKHLNQYGFNNTQFHSFYVDTLVTGGIALMAFFIGVLWLIYKNIYLIFKNDRHIGTVYLAAFISMLTYAVFESVSFFTMGYVGTLYTIFYISIPLMYSNNFKRNPGNDGLIT